jgi:hypothetical protein
MDQFARIVVGYHGCRAAFADKLLLGRIAIADWRRSENSYDWLGDGIYFWEHSSTRALRWARERFAEQARVIGAVIQLGSCFDLLDEKNTSLLKASYDAFRSNYRAAKRQLPKNRGKGKKLRQLDRAVINDCITDLLAHSIPCDTTRGAFLEGEPLFPGTTISAETHIQIAVRNINCILGVFRPNFGLE